jgi:hypothetical protein
MEWFYIQLTTAAAQDDVHWATLAQVMRLACRQLKALASDAVWHNW